MKMTWFQHPVCTTEEADKLVAGYRRRGVKVERSLNPDYISWTVGVKLPEYVHRVRTPGAFHQKVWG